MPKDIKQGWECPKCHAVWSPDEKSCEVCKPTTEDKDAPKTELLLE
jgi:hypothetical protein